MTNVPSAESALAMLHQSCPCAFTTSTPQKPNCWMRSKAAVHVMLVHSRSVYILDLDTARQILRTEVVQHSSSILWLNKIPEKVASAKPYSSKSGQRLSLQTTTVTLDFCLLHNVSKHFSPPRNPPDNWISIDILPLTVSIKFHITLSDADKLSGTETLTN